MAKEMREIIALHEQLAAQGGKPDSISRLQGLRDLVDAAEERGDLMASLPKSTSLQNDTEIRQENPLEQVVQEYKTKPLTPELITSTWHTIWQVWGGRVDREFVVPSFLGTKKELEKITRQGRMIVYVPDEIFTREGPNLLLGMFPHLRSAGEHSSIMNKYSQGGYYSVEEGIEPIYKNTTEEQLERTLKLLGRNGMRLPTYIVASQFSELLTGHYFDENESAVSRLTGTRITETRLSLEDGKYLEHNRAASYKFIPEIGLVGGGFYPLDNYPSLGGRSEEMVGSFQLSFQRED